MAPISDADLAWAAGFFDGEGSIQIHVAPNRCYMHVDIAQKDRRPLAEMHGWFGGSLGKPRPKSGVSYLRISTRQAAHFLRSVRPFLRVKHEQADVALAFQERRTPNGVGVDRARDIGDSLRLKEMKREVPTD